MPTFLLAMKDSDKFDINAEKEKIGHSCYMINSIVDPLDIPADTCKAFVDEDFDGPQTGWRLASKIRQTKRPIRIIMIANKLPDVTLWPLYDVLWGLPFSIEALKVDFERAWKGLGYCFDTDIAR